MPCYNPENDPYSHYGQRESEKIVYVESNNSIAYEGCIKKLVDHNKELEAMVCALISELETKGIANEIVTKASRSGLVDIVSFWERHRQDDITRIAKELHKYSEHEQAIIKTLLNK